MQTAHMTRRGLLVDDSKWDDDTLLDHPEDEYPEEKHEGEQGPLLVSRIIFAPAIGEDPWFRSNIFHSTCSLKGKVCQFIIDSGS